MKWTRLGVVMSLAAMVLLLAPGCGDKKEETKKSEKKTPQPSRQSGGGATLDRTDANSTARAFVQALVDKDEEKALSLIHADNREELKRDLKKGEFTVPDDWNVSVEVSERGGVKSGKFKGNVRSLRNLGMKFEDGKWWVAD